MDSWNVDDNITAYLCDRKEAQPLIKQGGKVVGKDLNTKKEIIWIENEKLEYLFK